MTLMKMFSLFALVFIISYRTIEGTRTHVKDELEKRLTMLNKPPIKTFKFEYGIFDCVDIYKQPAFDNPLLKDHKIQLEPTQTSIGVKSELSARSNRFGIHPGCPNGTVPVRRTTINDLIRENSLEQVHHYYPNTKTNPSVHFASIYVDTGKLFSSGKANIDIHNPQCNPGETSGAQIWLFNTHGANVGDGMSAGWMVDPTLYGGDAHTFLTTTWVGKENQGCTNLICPGFVQVDQSIPPGLLLPNISQFEGTLYKLAISISQDKETKNWWLSVGLEGNEVKVGYWPKELFYYLDEGAKLLSYGGVVRGIPGQPTPPMGSGKMDRCRYDHTAFVSNIKFTEFGDDKVYDLKLRHAKTNADCSNNYQVYYTCKRRKSLDFYFMYGGPRAYC